MITGPGGGTTVIQLDSRGKGPGFVSQDLSEHARHMHALDPD